MAQSAGQRNIGRKEIGYFNGVNNHVSSNMAVKEEMQYTENARAPYFGTIEKREGMADVGQPILSSAANYGLFNFVNKGGVGPLYRMTRDALPGGVNKIYYLDNSNIWQPLTGLAVGYPDPAAGTLFDTCVAEGDLYFVNVSNKPKYILGTGGTTVYDTSGPGSGDYGNLFRCPNATLINYYKDHLYVANYKDKNGNILPNTVLMSSPRMGLLALVQNDVAANTTTVIPVTDSRYFISGETVEIWRGNKLIESVTLAGNETLPVPTYDGVQETTITLTTMNSYDFQASDEIYVQDTHEGTINKRFRWVATPQDDGVNAKGYDTFKICSTTDNDNEEINVMTNVGNTMLIATNSNVSIWNNYVLQNLDLGYGCVSKQGYVKLAGSLFFIHYTGIYQTNGGIPQYISVKISKYIEGATKAGLQASCAGKKDRSIYFTLGDVTLKNPDGSVDKVLNDVAVEYNIDHNNWYVFTNWSTRKMCTYISSDDPDRLVAMYDDSSTDIKNPIVEMLAPGTYLDRTKEIPFRIDTVNLLIGNSFTNYSYLQEVPIEMERGSGLKCFVSLDWGDWYELQGEANKGVTIFKGTSVDDDTSKPVRCRNVRISFRHYGKQLCRISKFALVYQISPEEEQSSEDLK